MPWLVASLFTLIKSSFVPDYEHCVHALGAIDLFPTKGEFQQHSFFWPGGVKETYLRQILHVKSGCQKSQKSLPVGIRVLSPHECVVTIVLANSQDRADESDAAREKFFVPESAAPNV